MPIYLQRAASAESLRVYRRGEPVPGQRVVHPDQIAVEWAGRVGQPSSYGLLGGIAAASTVEPMPMPIGTFAQALVKSDIVTFGLPDEFAAAARRDPVVVTIAAAGEAGSSVWVFRSLASMLAALLAREGSVERDALWALWDNSRIPLN